jgi:hypothetical protein
MFWGGITLALFAIYSGVKTIIDRYRLTISEQ